MPTSDPTSADPFVGQTLLGRFVASRVVQRTPDVVTYDGIDQKTQSPVRIERPVTLRLAPEQVAKVKAVGPALARLKSSAGAIHAIEGGLHAGVPFVVLPPLAGGTLADRIRLTRDGAATGISARSIRPWLESVAATLDALHAAGICHGRLTPDAIIMAADGSFRIDGLPARQLLRAIGLHGRGGASTDAARAFRPPEAVPGSAPTPGGDQYALAALVAEALGRKPRAVEKALSARPQDRFPNCTAFARALLDELVAPQAVASGAADSAAGDQPLELAGDPLDAARETGPDAKPAVKTYELELDAVESESQLRASRRKSADVEEEDLAEITFTKPGQNLLTPKSKLDTATSLAGSRASWRRMASQFKGLPVQQQWITRGLIGLVVALAALWLVRVGWRAVDSLVQSGRQVAQTAMEKLKPDTQALRQSGGEFVQQMRGLWDQHVADDGSPVTNKVILPSAPQQELGGDGWPGRVQDRLDASQLQEPSDLIADLAKHKGVFVQDQGLGVFNVDDPRFPEHPPWMGGFGLARKGRGLASKPLLHGTLVHHAEDGSTFVGRYAAGAVRDFWCVQGAADDRIVTYAVLTNDKEGEPIADGVAFVMKPKDEACLAFVFADGELSGGQWCGVQQNEEKETFFSQPRSIQGIDDLVAADERVSAYKARLDKMLAALPEIQEAAVGELRKFVRARKLK
jgi:hypothetical protein